MARRMPPRYKSGPKKGQFMSKRARSARKRKRNPGRTVQAGAATGAARSHAATAPNPRKRRRRPAPVVARRRRPTRYNPRRRTPAAIMGTFIDSTIEAGQVLIGKALVRTVPDMAGLPKEGYTGIAVQIGSALAIGFVADMFVSKGAARALTAGALTAPLETLIVANRVPWLSGALSPVTASNGLSAYVMPRRIAAPAPGVGRYARAPRLSRVSAERGMGDGGYN